MFTLGTRLRETRIERNLTQNVLSEKVDVALRTYQCYEQGRIAPSLEVLIRLANVLDVSIDYLVGRDDFIQSQNNENI